MKNITLFTFFYILLSGPSPAVFSEASALVDDFAQAHESEECGTCTTLAETDFAFMNSLFCSDMAEIDAPDSFCKLVKDNSNIVVGSGFNEVTWGDESAYRYVWDEFMGGRAEYFREELVEGIGRHTGLKKFGLEVVCVDGFLEVSHIMLSNLGDIQMSLDKLASLTQVLLRNTTFSNQALLSEDVLIKDFSRQLK